MKKFTHVPCGGLIDVKKRQCQKCNHKWSRTEMLFDPYSIRLIEYEDKSKVTKNTSYAKWADRFPVIAETASKLPDWPRWLRITSFLGSIIVLSTIIYFIYTLIRGWFSK